MRAMILVGVIRSEYPKGSDVKLLPVMNGHWGQALC